MGGRPFETENMELDRHSMQQELKKEVQKKKYKTHEEQMVKNRAVGKGNEKIEATAKYRREKLHATDWLWERRMDLLTRFLKMTHISFFGEQRYPSEKEEPTTT